MRQLFSFIVTTVVLCAFLQGCSAYNWPYYKLHASNARVINRSACQYTIEIPITTDVTLHIASHCYPKSDNHFYGYQPCDIWVDLYSSASTNVNFVNLDFMIENLRKPVTNYHPRISVFSMEDFKTTKAAQLRPGIIRKKWLKVDLEYEHDDPPKKFKLHLPALIIGGKAYAVPAITGIYKRNTQFFWGFVNW